MAIVYTVQPATMATHRPSATVIKHSLLIAGHQTSVSLEGPFWDALKRVAETRKLSVAGLVAEIDAGRGGANLSSAIRVYLLEAATSLNSGPVSTDR